MQNPTPIRVKDEYIDLPPTLLEPGDGYSFRDNLVLLTKVLQVEFWTADRSRELKYAELEHLYFRSFMLGKYQVFTNDAAIPAVIVHKHFVDAPTQHPGTPWSLSVLSKDDAKPVNLCVRLWCKMAY
jgi:hypothetical protein